MEPVACPPIKRRNLAILLQKLEPLPGPKVTLEQYQTPPEIAADVLFKAYGMRDIYGKVVADLGCGNGILAVGASRIGAERVIAIDTDPDAIEVAARNALALGVEPEFHVMEVKDFNEKVDTVLMNPPFGAQRKHADIPFIEAALRSGEVSYTLTNSETRDFISGKVRQLGGSGQLLTTYKFPLPHAYPFHRREVEEVEVDLLRVVRSV